MTTTKPAMVCCPPAAHLLPWEAGDAQSVASFTTTPRTATWTSAFTAEPSVCDAQALPNSSTGRRRRRRQRQRQSRRGRLCTAHSGPRSHISRCVCGQGWHELGSFHAAGPGGFQQVELSTKYWALVSNLGFLKFQIFRFSILEIFFLGNIFLKFMLVRYRGINNKGVLERPWTIWRVLEAISTTLKCQFTGNC